MEKELDKKFFRNFRVWWGRHLTFCVLLSVFLSGLSSVHGQGNAEVLITLKMSDATLQEVLGKINQLTRNTVVFKQQEVARETKRLSVEWKDVKVFEAVEECLQNTQLTCVERNGKVVIGPKRSEALKLKGFVTDEKNFPLPGVTILLKGSALGTSTDNHGRFSLTIPNRENVVLVFSFVGMETQEMKCTEQDSVHVILREKELEVGEVVVTGYQVVDKRELTSSVVDIDANELEKMNVLTVDQMLEGKAPGLLITNLSATPGAAAKIRVRASGTFTSSQEPLWVVDGIPYEDPVPLSAAEINSFDQVNLIGNAITGLNPQDIKSITILKDASATAIYGTRAANGVIVITTKRGEKGRARLTYSGSVGIVDRPRYRNFNVMNSCERIDVSREIYKKGLAYPKDIVSYVGYEGALRDYLSGSTTFGEFQDEVSYLESMNTDWFGELYRQSLTMSHNLNVSGGAEHTKYYFSIGYNLDDGAEKGVGVKRLTARSNLDVALRPNLKLQLSMSGSVQEAKYNHSSINVFDEAYYASRAVPFRDKNGELFYLEKKMDEWNGKILTGKYNVRNEMDNSERNIDNKDLNLNATLNWNIIQGIKLSGTLSYRNTTNLNEEWITENTYYVAKLRTYDGIEDKIDKLVNTQASVPFGGLYSTGFTSQNSYMMRLQLNLNKVLFEHHALNLNLGYEANSVKYKGVNGITAPGYNHSQGRSFITLPRYSLNTNGEITSFGYISMLKWLTGDGNFDIYPTITDQLKNKLSFFMIFNYSFSNRYVFNFNMRSDGSNTFGQYERYKFRPAWSLSARWNIHSENFMPKGGAVDELALRMSFGFRGTSPSALPYMVIRSYRYNSRFNENTSTLASFPNANLTWERTSTLNVGLNHSWFGGRLSGAFDFAYSKGVDLLLSRPVSLVNGQATQTYNGGSKEDFSYEMSIRGVIVDTENFGWSLNGNVTHTSETVLAGQELESNMLDVNDYLSGSIHLTGFPSDAFYSYQFDGLNEQGFPTFKNLHKAGKSIMEYFSNVLIYSGRRTPKVYGGFGTEFRYKNLTLSANFSYKFGQSVRRLALYSGSQNMPMPYENMSAEFNERWRKPGDEAYCVVPGLSNKNLRVGTTSGYDVKVPYGEIVASGSNTLWHMYDKSDLRVVKGDFIRWQSLTLGYTLPKKALNAVGISSCRLSLQVSNLGVLAFDKKLKGQDPEQVQGIGMPTLPNYNLGLNISF